MPWTERDQANYDRLRQKRRAAGGTAGDSGRRQSRRNRREDEAGDDGLYVLSGRHADSFLDRLFGNDSSNVDDDNIDDEEEDDEEEDDPPAPSGNRFFRDNRR